MSINNISYIYDKKTYQKITLRYLRPVTILTFVPGAIALVLGIVGPILYYFNDRYKVAYASMMITAYILVFVISLSQFIYRMCFKNKLITINNSMYKYDLSIENDIVNLTLKAADNLNVENYSFKISKIKQQGDNYLIYKDKNHFIYAPVDLIDKNRI